MTKIMSVVFTFLLGIIATLSLISIATPDEAMPGTSWRKLDICEKSLPRDQKCIIVAIPNVEQKALNEIKGEMK